ncbi:aminopeptidase P family protein [Ochrobactrum sp. MYb15]|uniref:Aminopeptidase P family protein n=1 Tax=Brucella pituitosa TaxID=571256 RepID=A0ABS3JYQ7_9HYPH|nr:MULTISPECIES: Xaa-Pro peptidase family protein [Brucella]PQZ51435.1 aminopeptidase P family protein [Ochrobactrum sp. MYb19]PRA65531.1 aminopeptidase P family protein [Ochrobactrum sp. MYb18]PRA77221.1 aminopeptidase P family protein [Brucella thiophenivorans]PRA93144.1 aminopeptidase P family protein [Ochrobactrum sp. MYb14]PRA99231.1 aminopeptidase P family protein [Ochrobactrum sp. MYb15]
MALHFEPEEFAARRDRLILKMEEEKLDALLLFAQESMYWLTGYDTFGFCFFQCLVVKADGSTVLMTRSADLRQARHTSNIDNITVWTDRDNANPAIDLRNILTELDLLGTRIGIEYQTHGLTGANARKLDEQLQSFAKLFDASGMVDRLRLLKSPAEITYAKRAAELSDDALDAALKLTKAGASEADILAAMMSANFAGDGDYPANEYIIGSGADALLCRYKAGRRTLSANDQLTLEWSGVFRHYHAPMMRTVIIGQPKAEHLKLYNAAREALEAVETAMTPASTFGDVFDAHSRTMEAHGLTRHRLNACGYSVGARFTPSWMDPQMFYSGNPESIQPDMTLFAHMIIMDSDTETAMTLGQTYLTTNGAAVPLSRHSLDIIVK